MFYYVLQQLTHSFLQFTHNFQQLTHNFQELMRNFLAAFEQQYRVSQLPHQQVHHPVNSNSSCHRDIKQRCRVSQLPHQKLHHPLNSSYHCVTKQRLHIGKHL